jgi:CRISPR-associated exonuclease Cas4
MEELHIWQVKYYIYFLEKLGITGVTGEIDYPKLKRIVRVNLEDEDRQRFEEIFIEIESINNSSYPPQPINKPYCKKCSYFEFCYC